MKCSESIYAETYDINKNSKYETSRKTAGGNGADPRGCILKINQDISKIVKSFVEIWKALEASGSFL